MRNRLIPAALCLGAALALLTSEPLRAADAFPGLKSLTLPGYEPASIHFDPAITTVINRQLNPDAPDDGDIPVIRVLETKLDRTSSQIWVIDYTEGPSADPEFMFTRKGAAEPAGYVTALELWLPGNGAAYAAGHADTMFDTRRKLVAKGDKVVEVAQPFYHVGLEGKALKDLVLYGAKDGKEVVANIPKGSPVTVLLASGEEWYLAKTAFGLVGWIRVEPWTVDASVVDGLYYAGD